MHPVAVAFVAVAIALVAGRRRRRSDGEPKELLEWTGDRLRATILELLAESNTPNALGLRPTVVACCIAGIDEVVVIKDDANPHRVNYHRYT